MLKMRLQRIGRKNDASFRVIVTDSRSGPKSGKNVALLGSYNPKLNRFEIDGEKAKEWIGKGVQVSDTVHNLLVSNKIIDGKKVNVLPRKSPIINEEKVKAEEEAKAEAEEKNDAAPETDGGTEQSPEETSEEKPEMSASEEGTEEIKAGDPEAASQDTEASAEEEQKKG